LTNRDNSTSESAGSISRNTCTAASHPSPVAPVRRLNERRLPRVYAMQKLFVKPFSHSRDYHKCSGQELDSLMAVLKVGLTLLPFSNSVLAKLTIDTFTGMCPAVFLHLLKYWYRHITIIMWLYNALKLKKTYSFTVFSTFSWLFKVSCGVLRFSVIPPSSALLAQSVWSRIQVDC